MPEAIQPFWAALQAGEFITDAAVVAGTYRKQGPRWVEAGGVRPRRGRDLKGRCLSFAEREEIALARARGETIRVIAGAWAVAVDDLARAAPQRRPPRRLPGDDRARAGLERASRPKPAKLATNLRCASSCRTICAALLARADRRAVAPPVPRRPGDVGV